MPVYNGDNYLNEAIESILNQTFSDFELLIIDDCSTDQSINQVKSYNDPRIKLFVNNKNMGQSKTLNEGLNLSKGRYIARMDQDDISMPERLERQSKFMKDNPNVDVVGTWLQLMGKYDEILELETKSEDIKMNLLTNENLAHPSVMIRKRVLEKYNFIYDTSYNVAQDYDLWVRMFDFCSFANIPEALIKYRMHDNQNSNIMEKHNHTETNRILKNLLKKMDIQPNESDLIIHKKLFTGYDIDSLLIGEVFKYLRQLRSSNLRNKIFDPNAFNEFLRMKWRRFMLRHKHKLLYWISTLLFFRPVNYLKKTD